MRQQPITLGACTLGPAQHDLTAMLLLVLLLLLLS
jgi:hypothetical protein